MSPENRALVKCTKAFTLLPPPSQSLWFVLRIRKMNINRWNKSEYSYVLKRYQASHSYPHHPKASGLC